MLPFTDKEPIRLSSFAHQFIRRDVLALVHALKSTPVYADVKLLSVVEMLRKTTTMADIASALKDEEMFIAAELFISHLVEAKMVVPKDYDESAYLNQIRSTIFCGPHFDILFMLLTEACNLKCTYCFIEGGKPKNYRNAVMSKETARAAIDKFVGCKAPDGDKSVIFYGGEPLLNKSTFLAIQDYLDWQVKEGNLPTNLERILITNGTLIDEEMVGYFKKYGIYPYVSIDGPPELHNSQRPYRKNGRGSFKNAVRGLELIRTIGIEPGISVTVTEPMIDSLPEILEWLIVNLKVKSVGFNMLEAIPGRTYFSAEYGKRFAEALIKCNEITERYKVYEERIARKLKKFAQQEVYVYDCAACGGQLTIAPDGQVGVCQGFVGTREFFSGNVNDPMYDPRKDSIFQEWSKISPLNKPGCMQCPALGICGGGCPRNPYIEGKGIHAVDERFCNHTLRTQEWIVFSLYDKLNVQ